MGYNYCLVIASSAVKDQVISKLAEEALKVDVITGPGGKALVRKGNILLSYEGNACTYFGHDLPGKTLTLYIDGRDCSNFASGNWKLAKSYNASLTLNMGYKVLRSDLKNIEKDKDISKLLKRIERTQSSVNQSADDDAEEFSFEVEIASEKDVLSAQTLAQCISDLATSLNKKEYEHYAAWYTDGDPDMSGDLQESVQYPLSYADAQWDGNTLHVTNSDIFRG